MTAPTETQPPSTKSLVPRRTAWLIWGLAVLLASLTLAAGLSLALHAYYIRQNNNRWCQFYVEVTAHKISDTELQVELEQLEKQTGC